MITNRLSTAIKFALLAALLIFMAGCEELRPVRPIPTENQSPIFVAPTFQSTLSGEQPDSQIQVQQTAVQPSDCVNGLTFLSDLTYPDGTHVASSSPIDKQWKVKNSGTCNWDDSYSLRMTSGDAMGTNSPLALVPARNGTETVLSIQFVAPVEPGRYTSTWKAYGADGEPFGDPVYIEINVAAP